MSIIRLVHFTYPEDKADEAARSWKEKLGPSIARQPGCLSEELLRCEDVPNEFVSYSVWDGEDSVRRYLESETFQEVRAENRKYGASHVTVRLYGRV